MNIPLPELIGIVACGGVSSRMGQDKSLLVYHEKPHRYFLYDLLKTFCKNVFISCNENQAKTILPDYNFIPDKKHFQNHGPVSGLLSAFDEHPDKSILYVGCDYPFLTFETVHQLIVNRKSNFSSVCYKNSQTDFLEPLIAIYENSCFTLINERFAESKYSLRELLEITNSIQLTPTDSKMISSIDSIEQFQEAKKIIEAEIK